MRQAAALVLALVAGACAAAGSEQLLDRLHAELTSTKAEVAAKAAAVESHLEAGAASLKADLAAKLAAKSNPPLMFVPGLFGSYLTVTITEAGCDAMAECRRARDLEPLFVERVIAGPVKINDFLGKPWLITAPRVPFLIALLTQTYNQAANTLDYAPGVTVGTKGTPAGAYCDGVSSTYVNGIIDGYLVDQVGYQIGKTLACTPYNWELDMLGQEQAGYFDRLAAGIEKLYNSPYNAPPLPWMPRKKVVLMGHSMGTLFSTSAMLANPALRDMVDKVVLLSPVAAGSALTWELTLDGGLPPSMQGLLVPGLTPEEAADAEVVLRLFLWRLAQIGAVNPTLAPYDLPPYTFKTLTPPPFPNGFPPAQSVGLEIDRLGIELPLNITVASQLDALTGRLFRSLNGTSPLDYIASIWPRSHSYNDTVVAWSGPSPPANVSVFCGYGIAVDSILTTAIKAAMPFPEDRLAGFATIEPDPTRQAIGPGDGIVNLQGSNGCDRMADNTGGQALTCTSPDCEHVKIIENGAGARAFLNQLLTAVGINVHA